MATSSHQYNTRAQTLAPGKEIGFSVNQGANWSTYLVYRPLYPKSFFERIYNYHSQKTFTSWSVAHDIGAGCGVVSATLASQFNNVIVSDPNEGYTTVARKALIEESGIPESKLQFLQEGAEKSSVESGTVDLLTVCECIHWTNPVVAIQEFNRELRPGGTVVITHYTVPRILENERAQGAWAKIWDLYSENCKDDDLLAHAFRILNTGFDHLEFPPDQWSLVKRQYINAHGSLLPFKMNHIVAEDYVHEGERKVFDEGDEDWTDVKGFDWFKGYQETWVPTLPESKSQELWNELELALNGQKAKIETPVVMVFATKKN
jgi:trans-aconitate 3-methyltransferase